MLGDSHRTHSPEARLVVAILEDAVQCVLDNVQAPPGPRRREFLQARAWFLDDRRDWPFAFANLCDVLNLDVRAVREHLPLAAPADPASANTAPGAIGTDAAAKRPRPRHRDTAEQLQRRLDELKAELNRVQLMRRGSLVVRYRKCGKSNCYCADAHSAGHGPSFSLTWQENGKTRTKAVPAQATELTKHQIAEYRRFRRLCAELVQVSERLCEVSRATEM